MDNLIKINEGEKMKLIFKILKKLCFAFIFLYGIDLIFESMNIVIPINVFTLSISTILGLPGIVSLFVTYLIII